MGGERAQILRKGDHMKIPNKDTLRMVYGFCLMFLLAFLALRIALGNVQEQTSFGLPIVLNTIGILAGGFNQWAFSASATKEEPKPGIKPDPGHE
jgi:hypothetical protein